MPVQILEVRREFCSAARLIGRRYENALNWGEWWANGWFDQLEQWPRLPFNDDAYIGAVRIVNGKPEHWIGMFFPENAEIPDGFEAVDIPPQDYAVCYLYGKEGNRDFYTLETYNRCLEALEEHGFVHGEDGWRFERYQCPRFTTPDEQGCVILDYGISVL